MAVRTTFCRLREALAVPDRDASTSQYIPFVHQAKGISMKGALTSDDISPAKSAAFHACVFEVSFGRLLGGLARNQLIHMID